MTSTSCEDSLAPILDMSIFQLTVAYYKKCMFETTVDHEVLKAYNTSLYC